MSAHRYGIRYPSGRSFELTGELRVFPSIYGPRFGHVKSPMIIQGDEASSLDPRADIVDYELNRLVYVGCTTEELEEAQRNAPSVAK